MSKIKFTAKVNQGNIEIPEEYQEAIQEVETIEIIVNRQAVSKHRGIIHYLLDHPIEMQNFTPLTRDEVHER
ncbi:MAG: hypothetical protein AB4368_25680 [Xenococcaceae cyanobacterium]